MFSRRLSLMVGLLSLVVLSVVIWILQINGNDSKDPVVKTPNADVVVSNDEGNGSKADRTRSSNKEQQTISDAEKLRLAQTAFMNVQFPSKVTEAENKLKEDLKYLYSLPFSSERMFMQSSLVESYSKAVFETSSSKEELLARMQRFGTIIKNSAVGDDIERLLISASKQCAKMIGGLPSQEGEVLRDYLRNQGAVGDEQMGARIIASCYVETLVSSEAPDAALFDGIGDSNVRKLAERTFLRTFDFGRASEKIVETFAARYFNAENNINSDHVISVKLFGVGLQRYPEAISAVILDAPPGQKKDEAIEQMILRIAQSDPERADLWREQIQDPDIKKRAGIKMEEWRRRVEPPAIAADPSKNPFK